MSCSKYHYVKFLDEVEEITDSKTNDDEEKKNLIFSDSKMSSIDSEFINYLTYVSKIVSQLKYTKEENQKLKDENKKLKEENDKLKLMTFEADTRCDGIKIKMNKNWLSEDIDPILNDRDHIKNYFDELNNLPDNLDYEIEFKEDMEEPFYRNLVGEIQGCLNSLKIFGGIHSGHNIDEMIGEIIHDFVNEALTDGDYFEIEVEEESEEEEEESEEEEDDKENIKKLNDYEICKMMLMDRITKQIEDKITHDDQVDIWLPRGFYREHYINFIKDVIIPELTTHTNGDSEYSSFRNGYYYYDNDCMNPYELQYNGEGCLLFNRVETDDEVETSSEEEEEEEQEEDKPRKLVDLAGAREWMSKNSSNQICIMNFSDNEEYYWLDGGTDAIDELHLDNYEEEDLDSFEFYIVENV